MCQSKGLEHSLLFTHLPLSGTRACSLMRVIPLEKLHPSQMSRRLQLARQTHFCAHSWMFFTHGEAREQVTVEHQFLQAAWASANQSAAQPCLHQGFQDVTVFLGIAESFGVKPAPDQDDLWCPASEPS